MSSDVVSLGFRGRRLRGSLAFRHAQIRCGAVESVMSWVRAISGMRVKDHQHTMPLSNPPAHTLIVALIIYPCRSTPPTHLSAQALRTPQISSSANVKYTGSSCPVRADALPYLQVPYNNCLRTPLELPPPLPSSLLCICVYCLETHNARTHVRSISPRTFAPTITIEGPAASTPSRATTRSRPFHSTRPRAQRFLIQSVPS